MVIHGFPDPAAHTRNFVVSAHWISSREMVLLLEHTGLFTLGDRFGYNMLGERNSALSGC